MLYLQSKLDCNVYLPMWCAQCVADGLAFPEPCECESLHSLNIADATLARGEAQHIKFRDVVFAV